MTPEEQLAQIEQQQQRLANITSALAKPVVSPAPLTPAVMTDDEIVRFTVTCIENDDDVKARLLDELGIDEAEPFIEKAQASIQIDKEISQLETVNKELLESIPDPDEPGLQPLLRIPADRTDKLEALRKLNEKLVELGNKQFDKEELPEPEKPKFGSGLTVELSVIVNGERASIWIDEHGINIDTGERVVLTPELQKLLDERRDQRRKEKADEAVKKLEPKEPHELYAMTQEEHEAELEKEYPVFVLPKQPGPSWDDSILYGPVGDMVRKASAYSESHPAGMLLDFLVSFGNIVGRGPYFNVNATKHYTNEFMARVGQSSTSRKGGARDAMDEILKMIDPNWFSNQIEGGFGSGQAIIGRVRDARTEMHKTRTGFEEVKVPGVTDKRLCIRENELATVFTVANQPESQASNILRDAWDSKTLRNTVKGKGTDGVNNSARCEEPHISISGDTTVSELRQTMPTGAADNGFGNRFIYVYVFRTKDCPQGGPQINWDTEILLFHKVLQFAKAAKHVAMTQTARNWWNKIYSTIEHDGPDGLVKKMTSRGAAHIRRIAMIYALIDMQDKIELEHFLAAKKLWDYCTDSAMFIFGQMTKEQLKIVQWISQRGPVKYQQVRDDLYYRNRPPADIRADLKYLVDSKKLLLNGDLYHPN